MASGDNSFRHAHGMPTFGIFHRQISATGGDDFKRPSKREVCFLQSLSKKQILHKTRAHTARLIA